MDIEKLDSWGSLLRAVPVTALVMLVAQFLGWNFIAWARRLPQCFHRRWVDFHFASVLGLNLLGLLALVTSLLPLTIKYIFFLVLSLIAGYWAFRPHGSSKLLSLKDFLWTSWKSTSRFQLLMGSLIAFTLGPALAYPSGWDELMYHIELPRRWFTAASFNVQFDLPYSALPSLPEMIFTLAYPIETLITPRLLIWIVWLHGLFVFRDACGQVCSRLSANSLTFALVASPIALFISANCYVESIIWANVACLLHMIVTRSAASPAQWRESVVMGVFIGGVIAIKMTSVGWLCLPVMLSIWRIQNARLAPRDVLTALLTAVCFAGPFYLRTWLLTGNPVTPFYAQWFTADATTIECSHYHHDLAVGNFGIPGLPGFIVGPGALAFANELYDGTLGWQWPLTLMLLVVAIVHALKADQPHRSLLMLCLTTVLLFYTLWFFTSQQARFALPLVMIVVLAAGRGIESYRMHAQRWWRVAVVGLTLVSLPWNNFGYYLDSWFCVLKVRSPLDYIRDGTGDSYAELVIHLEQHVPADAKIISLFEHRLAYLPAGVEIGTPYFQLKHFQSPATQTAESLIGELRDKGIQFVVLTTSPLGPDVSASRVEAQQKWFQCVDQCIDSGHLKIVWKSEFHGVAEVKP